MIVLKTRTRFSIKNQMTEYRRIDIKFPTERDKQSIDILSRSHQRHIMEYVQSHLTFKNLASFFRTSHKLQGYSRRRYYNCSPATKEDYSPTAHRRYSPYYARTQTAPNRAISPVRCAFRPTTFPLYCKYINLQITMLDYHKITAS